MSCGPAGCVQVPREWTLAERNTGAQEPCGNCKPASVILGGAYLQEVYVTPDHFRVPEPRRLVTGSTCLSSWRRCEVHR